MDEKAVLQAESHHVQQFGDLVHAYPVLSRRARGISIGVNLNLDKVCNYDCAYCQVDRRTARPHTKTDPALVIREVSRLLDRWEEDRLRTLFPGVDPEHLRLNDVALSGDGESTMDPSFAKVCAALADLQRERREAGKSPFRLVLISNATLFHLPKVQTGLQRLCGLDGEVWGKLDAGTQEYHKLVNHSGVSLERIQENLEWAAAHVPLRIQTLFFRFGKTEPSDAEIAAWLDRLDRICQAGKVLSLQLYTVVRDTAKPGCHPWALERLEAMGRKVTERTGLPVDCFGGAEVNAIGEEN